MAHVISWFAAAALAVGAAGASAQGVYAATPIPAAGVKLSQASDSKAYRTDAARHLYAAYSHRIYRGKLPPLIHAVVVVETEVDAQGRVVDVNFVRVPTHAPEVVTAVRNMLRDASPLPVPERMGGGSVKYTDIWLVDKSGRFQLDTLTEGQLMGHEQR